MSTYAPVDNAVQRVRAAVVRVRHHQELFISDGEKLPVQRTEHTKEENKTTHCEEQLFLGFLQWTSSLKYIYVFKS